MTNANMTDAKTTDTHINRMKDLPSSHILGAGTALCSGCGGLETLKVMYDILGENTVFVNAAGCMTLMCIYPFTPFRGSWLYTSMASAPAGAQGVRDALDILINKGRIEQKDDLQVVVLTGDGSASGMGLSSTSGAIDRKLDFIYLCYDNEGYANTGQQTSPETPLGARTSSDAVAAGHPGTKKDLFSIWAANNPTYVATVIGSEPLDMVRKIEKAKELKGPRLILSLAPCPTGWGYDPKDTIDIGRLAVKTGTWPLKEYKNGKIVHTLHQKSRKPVEEYLRLQRRFDHLFEPERNEAVLAKIQKDVDDYWSAVELEERRSA